MCHFVQKCVCVFCVCDFLMNNFTNFSFFGLYKQWWVLVGAYMKAQLLQLKQQEKEQEREKRFWLHPYLW